MSTEESERDTSMKEQISDSVGKWRGNLRFSHQQRIAHVALKFLRRVDSTICLIAAAYRLLARAPWTGEMIATDIKQAALYAVSKGWRLKMPHLREFPFSKVDFAVAAATYLEQVSPSVPEDPFHIVLAIIDFLPLICGSLFSQATLSCQWCEASCTVPVPCFITDTTWTMEGWGDFASIISKSKLRPWIQRHGWHNEGCDMAGYDVSLGNFGPCVYLQLEIEHHEDLPLVCHSMQIPRDSSLHLLDATVIGLLCTNDTVSIGSSRHYWVAEVENFAITSIYDVVDGKQKLTKALAKNLRVSGVLLCVGPSKSPTLRSKELDHAAGIIARVQRKATPIKVAGRLRLQMTRNAICKRLRAEATTGKKVKKHTLKSRTAKVNMEHSSSPGQKLNKKEPVAAARKRKQRNRVSTLPQFFSQTPVPQTNLWDKPLGNQCVSREVLEVPDDSPHEECLPNSKVLQPEGQGKVGLSTDPISDCSAELRIGGGDSQPQAKLTNSEPILTEELPNRPDGHDHQEADSLAEKKTSDISLTSPGKKLKVMTGSNTSDGFADTAKGCLECGQTSEKSPEMNQELTVEGTVLGNYGVVSLFDGASTVVDIVTQKIGHPPKAILLAENDETIRQLVCAEYGYRADQKWGYTAKGSACLYIKDVNVLAEKDCLLLREMVALFPGIKWIIIGGTPCQDLTFAGFMHGLIGLVGSRSRLFFLLLLTIRAMQVLVGCKSVRYLVENAGSMKDVHFNGQGSGKRLH